MNDVIHLPPQPLLLTERKGKKAYAYWMIDSESTCAVCWAIAGRGPYTDENPLPKLPAHKDCTCSVEFRFEFEDEVS